MRRLFLYGLAAVCVCQILALAGPAAQRPVHQTSGGGAGARDLTFEDRVRAQEAIERVYYSHQIGATKSFEEAVPREAIEAKVRRYLKLSVALEQLWNMPVTAAMLDGETQRIAGGTRMPARLEEIYAALGHDLVLYEECYARQVLVERLARDSFASDPQLHAGPRAEAESLREQLVSRALAPDEAHPRRSVVVLRHASREGQPPIDSPPAVRRRSDRAPLTLDLSPDEFRRFRAQAPAEVGVIGPLVDHRDGFTVAVVLAESDATTELATFETPKLAWSDWWGGAAARFDETDARQVVHVGRLLPSPTGRSTASGTGQRDEIATRDAADPQVGGAPTCACSWENRGLGSLVDPRLLHSAVWTGSQMIVWGGTNGGSRLDTGSRYDPTTDTWTPTSSTNAPTGRAQHTVVWTGARMIIWGGYDGGGNPLDTGGRYDPTTDTWSPTSLTNAPSGRSAHTAVWTGTRMIVWGGDYVDTGGRYDPTTDTWSPTSTTNAPAGRAQHTAVWTGAQMIIWVGMVRAVTSTPAADTTRPPTRGRPRRPQTLRQDAVSTRPFGQERG
jgi:hypothetical protein